VLAVTNQPSLRGRVGRVLIALTVGLFGLPVVAGPALAAPGATTPVVAIHISANNRSAWPHGGAFEYDVLQEALRQALSADGTPYVEVSDADIASGLLLDSGTPRYPIVITLGNERVSDTGRDELRNYVSFGGFLLVGASALIRTDTGASRGNFALAAEMGLDSLGTGYVEASQLRKITDNRLVSHIPSGLLKWDLPRTGEEPNIVSQWEHFVFPTSLPTASPADVMANSFKNDGTDRGPLIATRAYNSGRFVYFGSFSPILGHGSFHSDMYSYMVIRNAIEWAFEAAELPILKRSTWQYDYDAAYLVRHDYESVPSYIQDGILFSAQEELALGQAAGVEIKGDYFFTTGSMNDGILNSSVAIANMRTAVTSPLGATVASHNGGLEHPVNFDSDPGNNYVVGDYAYRHWGPDEALNVAIPNDPLSRTIQQYIGDSVRISFEEIEGWMSAAPAVDNGPAGCGTSGTGGAYDCPRVWAAPGLNSTRDQSQRIVEGQGPIIGSDQAAGPFPHETIPYVNPLAPIDTAGPSLFLSVPVNEWYPPDDGNPNTALRVVQSIENYPSVASLQAAIDYYDSIGSLINIIGHRPTNRNCTGGGAAFLKCTLQHEYVEHLASDSSRWSTNHVGLYDWWAAREDLAVSNHTFTQNSPDTISASLSGATHADTSIEVVIPDWASGDFSIVEVKVGGAVANTSDWRTTDYGVKVRVGTASSVEVTYGGNASIGDLVWHDLDGNGAIDGGEPGVDGVDIDLYLDDGTSSGLLDAGDTFLTTETTTGGGSYTFAGLTSGDYIVDIDETSSPLGGFSLTTANDPLSVAALGASQTLITADFGFQDTEDPTWPGGAALTASNITTSSVDLGWPNATDNDAVAGYRVIQDTVVIATLGPATLNHQAGGLDPGFTYTFEVEAFDKANNTSVTLSRDVTTGLPGGVDVLLQHSGSGLVALWELNTAGGFVSAAAVSNPGSSTWQVVGTGDFVAGGGVDVLLQNTGTGLVALWELNTSGGFVNASVVSNPGSNAWQAVGVGDFIT